MVLMLSVNQEPANDTAVLRMRMGVLLLDHHPRINMNNKEEQQQVNLV
jgi:hypothetical protein